MYAEGSNSIACIQRSVFLLLSIFPPILCTFSYFLANSFPLTFLLLFSMCFRLPSFNTHIPISFPSFLFSSLLYLLLPFSFLIFFTLPFHTSYFPYFIFFLFSFFLFYSALIFRLSFPSAILYFFIYSFPLPPFFRSTFSLPLTVLICFPSDFLHPV